MKIPDVISSIFNGFNKNSLSEKLKSIFGGKDDFGGFGTPPILGDRPSPFTTFGEPQLPINRGDNRLPQNWPRTVETPTPVTVSASNSDYMCLIADLDSNLMFGGAMYGTGFHVGGNWLLTAHHVLPDVEFLTSQRAWFYNGSKFEPHEFSTESKCYHASLDGIRADDGYAYEFDYAIAKLATPIRSLVLASAVELTVDQRVDILRPIRKENSGGEPVFGFGIVRSFPSLDKSKHYDKVEALDNKLIFHSCSSYPGDSGAPIVNDAGFIVGIHTHEFQPEFGATEFKRTFNWGASIQAIADDLNERAPDIYGECVGLHKT